MSFYVKYWSDDTIELIYVRSGWRKKRYHFLINPKDVQQILSAEGEINHESVTHIIALKTPSENEYHYEKIAEISEWLNKPIITLQEEFQYFRKVGVPINQLRSFETMEEIFHEIKLYNVKYEKSIFNPENERLEPTAEAKQSPVIEAVVPETIYGFVGFAMRPIQFLTKLIFSTFKKQMDQLQLFPIKKRKEPALESLSDNIPEENIQLLCEISATQILIPLDWVGRANLKKGTEKFEPEITIAVDINLNEVFSYPNGPSKLVLLDSEYNKDEPTFIPKAFNPQLPFDVVLSGLNQWVEVT